MCDGFRSLSDRQRCEKKALQLTVRLISHNAQIGLKQDIITEKVEKYFCYDILWSFFEK